MPANVSKGIQGKLDQTFEGLVQRSPWMGKGLGWSFAVVHASAKMGESVLSLIQDVALLAFYRIAALLSQEKKKSFDATWIQTKQEFKDLLGVLRLLVNKTTHYWKFPSGKAKPRVNKIKFPKGPGEGVGTPVLERKHSGAVNPTGKKPGRRRSNYGSFMPHHRIEKPVEEEEDLEINPKSGFKIRRLNSLLASANRRSFGTSKTEEPVEKARSPYAQLPPPIASGTSDPKPPSKGVLQGNGSSNTGPTTDTPVRERRPSRKSMSGRRANPGRGKYSSQKKTSLTQEKSPLQTAMDLSKNVGRKSSRKEGVKESNFLTRVQRAMLQGGAVEKNNQKTDSTLMTLAKTNPKLADLKNCVRITTWGVKQFLEKCNKLAYVYFSGCSQLTSLKEISTLPNLQILDLSGCSRIQDWSFLNQLKELTDLTLTGCGWTMNDLWVRLKNQGKLDKLSINSDDFTGMEPRWRGVLVQKSRLRELGLGLNKSLSFLNLLTHVPFLERLDLSFCRAIGKEEWAKLKGLKNLESLNLTACNLKGAMSVIKDLARLKRLSLAGCSSVSSLVRNLPVGLTHLNLARYENDGFKVTDRVLASLLKRCPNLQGLNLSRSEITKRGLKTLKNCNTLRKVSLNGCQKLKKGDVEAFRTEKQQCKVSFETSVQVSDFQFKLNG